MYNKDLVHHKSIYFAKTKIIVLTVADTGLWVENGALATRLGVTEIIALTLVDHSAV